MVDNDDKIWKKFIRKHFKMLVVFIVVAILAAMGAIYVFLWFVEEAQITGLVPEALNLWSMGYLITFIVNLIFWEVLYIGIPIIIAIVLIYGLWWKKLPEKEQKEYKHGNLFFGKNSKRSEGSGGISFLITVFFIMKIWLDGNWGVPFATWKFDYLVYSWITALVWVLVVFGIPIAIGVIAWIGYEMKKKA